MRALSFDGPVCTGVRAIVDDREVEYRGREMILCTGAIHTPAHLLRAGIGPAGDLRALGIEMRANLPGVGVRLMDHPSITLASFINRQVRMDGRTRRHIHVAMRYSSGLPGALIDIPITTLLIMRSIADIARAMGEDPAMEETKHACLQVLAFGGGNTEDDPEVAYWAMRAALTTLSSEMLIRQVAPRLGLAFSEKALAQAAPLLGAGSAGGSRRSIPASRSSSASVSCAISASSFSDERPNCIRRSRASCSLSVSTIARCAVSSAPC